MPTSSCYQLALSYVNICCVSLSEQAFASIVAPNIELKHQTNSEPPTYAKGAEAVTALFKKYIFANTSQVDIRSISLHECEDTISLKLVVEESKQENGRISRYLFHETTIFRFDINQSRIISIDSHVKRELPRSNL